MTTARLIEGDNSLISPNDYRVKTQPVCPNAKCGINSCSVRTTAVAGMSRIISHRSLIQKFDAFGWFAIEVADGHSVAAIAKALQDCRREASGKPSAIIVNTRKGNGVPGLQDAPLSHVAAIKPDLIDQLIGER